MRRQLVEAPRASAAARGQEGEEPEDAPRTACALPPDERKLIQSAEAAEFDQLWNDNYDDEYQEHVRNGNIDAAHIVWSRGAEEFLRRVSERHNPSPHPADHIGKPKRGESERMKRKHHSALKQSQYGVQER